ncbi:hypothetical protein L1049_008506 [Liquidambar formosana]|uniref:DUF309 domain-containing protein n=1 Tax=Liquidambar formosana TaxID=63359 RepID=A0AAP0S6F8_LIQFO
MAISSNPLKLPFLSSFSPASTGSILLAPHNYLNYCSLSLNPKSHADLLKHTSRCDSLRISYRFSSDGSSIADDDDDTQGCSFDEAVALFNNRDYYRCHDFLEALWNNAEEPIRTLIHGILQCAVGFHHLFNQNHRGAMMELGEGLCKLRKMNFDSGPFHQFEREISVVLDLFIKLR